MKGLQTMIASAVVIGLMLSSVGTALAEEPTSTANIFGEIVAKDQASSTEGFVEVKTKQGNIQIKLDASTQYKSGSLTDVSTGKKVALVASKANGTYIAKKVLVVPSEPTYLHLVGVVTSASETTATVSISDKQDASKAAFTIATQPSSAAPTPTPIEPGQYVTAVVSKDLRAMKHMTVRVTSASGKAGVPPTEVPQPTEVAPVEAAPTRVGPATGKAEVPPTEVPPNKYTELPSSKTEAPQPTKVAPVKVAPVEVVAPTAVAPSAEAPTGASTTATSTRAIARVTCIEMSPELVKQVWIVTPSEVSRRTFMNMPSDRVMEVWKNVPPELAKEIWISLPPELASERWMNLPPETKNIWIDLPPELETKEMWLDINSKELKQIWLNMPPQMAKEILRDMSPDLVKDVWIHIPPEQIKQIWMHLPAQEVKQIWMEMPTPTEATESSAAGGAGAGTIRVESVTVSPTEATGSTTPPSAEELKDEETAK